MHVKLLPAETPSDYLAHHPEVLRIPVMMTSWDAVGVGHADERTSHVDENDRTGEMPSLGKSVLGVVVASPEAWASSP